MFDLQIENRHILYCDRVSVRLTLDCRVTYVLSPTLLKAMKGTVDISTAPGLVKTTPALSFLSCQVTDAV